MVVSMKFVYWFYMFKYLYVIIFEEFFDIGLGVGLVNFGSFLGVELDYYG